LIKKLLPPLTKIIRETSAMSLLYECINGIIQGGILEAVEGTSEGEEVAKLCVGKLRGMMVIEGDSNCKLKVKITIFVQVSSFCSKICRLARFRENCPVTPVSGIATTGCNS
jgi:hypothetical protein